MLKNQSRIFNLITSNRNIGHHRFTSETMYQDIQDTRQNGDKFFELTNRPKDISSRSHRHWQLLKATTQCCFTSSCFFFYHYYYYYYILQKYPLKYKGYFITRSKSIFSAIQREIEQMFIPSDQIKSNRKLYNILSNSR